MPNVPTKGPVVIENMTKRNIIIEYITGQTPVLREGAIAKFKHESDQLILGSALDRDEAKKFSRQLRDNAAERKRDPSIAPIDQRDHVHAPEVHVDAKTWELIKKTGPAWKFLNAMARRRDIRVQAA